MTIRNWVKFFFNALLIGGIVTAVMGLIVRWEFFSQYLADGEIWQFTWRTSYGWFSLDLR